MTETAPTMAEQEVRAAVERFRAMHPEHVLVVKPCQGCKEAGEPSCTCSPQQWDVSIVCHGVTDNCRTWWECLDCSRSIAQGDEDLEERLEQDGTAHGETHERLENGWSTAGTECWGQECPDIIDAVEDLFGKHPIEPGEYRVRIIPDDQYLMLQFADDEAEPASWRAVA